MGSSKLVSLPETSLLTNYNTFALAFAVQFCEGVADIKVQFRLGERNTQFSRLVFRDKSTF